MPKFIDQPVTHRFTGAVLFAAKIAATSRTPGAVRLGLAVEWAIENKADLSRANLSRADLSRADLLGADLSRADLSRADLSGADLSWANLSWASLSGANLSRASLSRANLSWADLSRANLSRASLSRANLSWANLSGAIVRGEKVAHMFASANRSDDYTFFGFALEAGGIKILAGCRWFTVAEFRAHTVAEYPNTDKFRETNRILDFIEGRAADDWGIDL